MKTGSDPLTQPTRELRQKRRGTGLVKPRCLFGRLHLCDFAHDTDFRRKAVHGKVIASRASFKHVQLVHC